MKFAQLLFTTECGRDEYVALLFGGQECSFASDAEDDPWSFAALARSVYGPLLASCDQETIVVEQGGEDDSDRRAGEEAP